jgi:DNA processing protein
MSAYSSVTVIAEASEKSGTRIQANAAVKHARPLVITARVAATTTWGREYASGGYDVTVVRDAVEGRRAVREILARSEHTLKWLTRA